MPDLAAAYTETRDTMLDLARTLTDEQLAARVPACPDWTVRDLLAHVSSIAFGLVERRIPAGLDLSAFGDTGMASRRDDFVDELLAARSDWTLEDIEAEWARTSPALEAMMRGETPWLDGSPPFSDWVVLTDLAVHHHDMRGALAMPGARDSAATGISLRSYVAAMGFRTQTEDLPTLRIRAGTREWLIGDGEPAATVTAEPFELARAVAGRRSWDQVLAYDWEGDPQPFKPLFFPYGVREEPLAE